MPADYSYGEIDVQIGQDTSTTPPRPILVRLRYALVDFARLAVVPLWSSTTRNISAFTSEAKSADEKEDWPKAPYAGLKLVCNGTFNLSSGPAGHVVGHGALDLDLDPKIASYWPTTARAGARWFVGVDAHTGQISVGRGSSLSLPRPPPGNNEAWLKGRFRALLHGGAVLYDANFEPGTYDEPTYVQAFNHFNDDYNGQPAYGGMDDPAHGVPHRTGRWGIGLLGGTRIVIASTASQLIYPFARALYLARFGSERAATAVLFDGGSHHGFHACRDLEHVIGRPPSDQPQHPQTNDTFCHFGVFRVQNVAVRRLAAERVPGRYRLAETILSVRLRRAAEPLRVTVAVTSSDYLRATRRVQATLMQRRFHDAGGAPAGQSLAQAWNVDARHYGRDLVWTLSADETRRVTAWSDADPRGLACSVVSLDAASPAEIARHTVGLRLVTGVQTVFVLDDSGNVAGADLRAARDLAARMTAAEALARASLRAADGTPLGLPVELALAGVNLTTTVHLPWSGSFDAFRTALGRLGGPNGSDFNDAVRAVRNVFNPPPPGKRKSALVFVAGPHSGRPFHWLAVDDLRKDDVRLSVVGVAGAERDFVERLAAESGGTARMAAGAGEIVKLWSEAFAADLGDVPVKSLTVTPAPGAPHVEPLALRSTGVASIELHWDPSLAAPPDVGLLRADTGERVDASNVADHPDVTLVADQGFVVFLIANPAAAVSPGHEWHVAVAGSVQHKAQAGAAVTITAREEPVPAPELPDVVLVEPHVPARARAGVDLPVSIRTATASAAPHSVSVLARAAEQASFSAHALVRQPDGVWQGVVPGSEVRPGTLRTYFRAEAAGRVGLAPREAPASTYVTQVVADAPVPALWVAEYGGASAPGFVRLRIAARDAEGKLLAAAGDVTVPGAVWPKNELRLLGTWLADPSDGGVWVAHAPSIDPASPPLAQPGRLLHFDARGHLVRELRVPGGLLCWAVETGRGLLWALNADQRHPQLVTLDARSGRLDVRLELFQTHGIAVDERTGSVWVSGVENRTGVNLRRGIYRFTGDGPPQPFHTTHPDGLVNPCFLNPLSDGGLICRGYDRKLDRLARLDARGRVTHLTQAPFDVGVDDVRAEPAGERTWARLSVGGERHQVRVYDATLREVGRVTAAEAGVLRFDALALDPRGGVFVSGEAEWGRGFVAAIDAAGRVRQLARTRARALLQVALRR